MGASRKLSLSATSIGCALLTGAAALLGAHLAALSFLGVNQAEALFHLDRERNVPTMYSAALLLLIATILIDAGRKRRLDGARAWRSWHILAVVFVFLSVDEVIQFHEAFNVRTERLLETLNLKLPIFSWSMWVVPYGALVLATAFLSLQFLQDLDTTTRLSVVTAGALYVAGAIGMEVAGGLLLKDLGGWDGNLGNSGYLFAATLEEMLEIAGISVMLYALAGYSEKRLGGAFLHASPAPALALLLVGSLLFVHLDAPLRDLIGGRSSLFLLMGAFVVALLAAIFATIKPVSKSPIRSQH